MGLDMYLTKKTYIGMNFETGKRDCTGITLPDKEAYKSIQPERINEIEEIFGSWRKANAIHGWIVRNIVETDEERSEEYNGEEVYFDRDKMEELLNTCNTVIRASNLI